MVKLRIRKDNPEGRTTDVLDVFGQKVKVDTENWVEIDNSELSMLCINPVLYEIEGVKAPVVEDKPKRKSK